MERDFKGIWIPKEIWLSKDLTLQEKVFLVEIDSLDNEEGCFATNSYFAEFFGISKTRVSLVIKSLIDKKYIESTIVYKEGTKEILKRVLKVCYTPYLIKVKDPIQQKLKDNNTVNNISNNTINNISTKVDIYKSNDLLTIIETWNNLGLSQLKSIQNNRLKSLKARVSQYSLAEVILTIESINNSSFLKGQNNRNWIITFDWLIKPNNFTKVLEGNYLDKEGDNFGSIKPKEVYQPRPSEETLRLEKIIKERGYKIEDIECDF